MNVLRHAKNSVKKFGGRVEDYLPIHNWFDQTKNHVADLRHRVILHNSFGVALCVQVFGDLITTSTGRQVSVRAIAEQHVMEDQGIIPSLQDVLEHTPITSVQAPTLRKILYVEDAEPADEPDPES